MAQVTCTTHDLHDCTVVAITGEVSLSTAHDVLTTFRTVCGARSRIIVDLTGVTFMDSIGLGVLIDAQRRAHSAGGWMRLVCTNPAVLKVLRVTDLDHLFPIHETVDDARLATVTSQPLSPQAETTNVDAGTYPGRSRSRDANVIGRPEWRLSSGGKDPAP